MKFDTTLFRDDEHENAADYNFDHPDALDLDLAFEKLCELVSGKDIEIPTYDFTLHKRTKITETVKTAPIIIFEGIHVFVEERFRNIMDLKIFVLTPDDIRLSRRSKCDSGLKLTIDYSLERYQRAWADGDRRAGTVQSLREACLRRVHQAYDEACRHHRAFCLLQ